jgi:hypothetical protein
MLDATIAICTRNRADSLARTLDSLCHLRRPDGVAWEVLVVDNASTDATPQVLRRFAGRLPLRGAVEPRAGVSHARNRAVAEARGAWLLWTDDDVLVDADWLSGYVAGIRDYPDAAVFGGKIVPLLLPPTPAWFVRAGALLDTLTAARDFGPVALPLSAAEGRMPFGANYAVRLAEQRATPYDPFFGHGTGRVGEETRVLEAILERAPGMWLPDAAVRHCIPPARQTVAYVSAYFRAHGETAGLLEGIGARSRPGVPRWLWRRLAERWLRYHASRLVAPPEQWVRRLIDYAFARGQLDACLRREAATASDGFAGRLEAR